VDAGQPADTVHRAVRAAVGAVVGIADEDGPA
jgi:hypothetical protein